MSESDLQHEITQSFEEFETSYRSNYPLLWWSTLVGPFVLTGLILLGLALFRGPAFAGDVIGMACAAFFLAGRFIILAESLGMPTKMSSAELFVMLTYIDVMIAVFAAFNIGVLFRLPKIGPKIAGLVADAQFILRMQPWMRRATFGGLVVFVIFPTSTTGSIGGSIFGRLLGMNRLQTLTAIFAGSVCGNALMLLFSKQLLPLKDTLQESTVAKTVSLILILLIVVGIERWYKAMKVKYMETESDEASEPAEEKD